MRDGFIKTRRAHFVMNGSPYYANGFNAYWLMYLASDPSQHAKVSAAFRKASSHGLIMARIWVFNDGGYGPFSGSYNQQMSKVVYYQIYSLARRGGIAAGGFFW